MKWGVVYTCMSTGARTVDMRPYGHANLMSSERAVALASKLVNGKAVPSILAIRMVKQVVELYSGKLIIVDGKYVPNPEPPRQVLRFRNFRIDSAPEHHEYVCVCAVCFGKYFHTVLQWHELFSKLTLKQCWFCGLEPCTKHPSYDDLLPYLSIYKDGHQEGVRLRRQRLAH